MSPLQFLYDLLNPDLAFLPKALAVAAMSAVVCGLVGCHVVLRGMAFIGDAVAHAVFPGLAVAFVISGSLVVGGVVAGLVTAVLIAVFSQHRRLREDSLIGVFFVAAFALGIVVISRAPGYAGSLQQFLFGSITGIPDSDVAIVAGTVVLVAVVLFVLHKELVAIALDRESARALGVAVFALDLVLYVLVTLAVVISVQTIGNILVLALLVVPAATARLLTDRLGVMMALSPALGGVGALVGLYLSWAYDLPAGGSIVLVLTAAFLGAWFLAPRHGLVARMLVRRRGERRAPSRVRRWVPAAAAGVLVLAGAGALASAVALGHGDAAADAATPAALAAPTSGAPGNATPVAQPSGPAAGARGFGAPSGAGGTGQEVDQAGGPAAGDGSGTHAGSAQGAGSQRGGGPASGAGGAAPGRLVADPAWVEQTAASTGIPARVLAAYAGAALQLAADDPACGLGWNTLAGIGQVESAHGTLGGAALDVSGVANPAIVGVPLDGNGVSAVADTDGGVLDGDTRWDRAVGPLQFIPATWGVYAADGNGDGRSDPHQVDDAALAAARFLCDQGQDLRQTAGWSAAVAAYNPAAGYAQQVAAATPQ